MHFPRRVSQRNDDRKSTLLMPDYVRTSLLRWLDEIGKIEVSWESFFVLWEWDVGKTGGHLFYLKNGP